MDTALQIALDAGLPYTGLRGFEVDPRLWRYVPLPFARQERVVPLTLVGDELKLAAHRPDPDLSVLRRHLPNLAFGLVIASAAEIDAILAGAEDREAA